MKGMKHRVLQNIFFKNITISQFEGISKWEKNRNEKLLNLTFLLLLRDEFTYIWRPESTEKSLWNILLQLYFMKCKYIFNKTILIATQFDSIVWLC